MTKIDLHPQASPIQLSQSFDVDLITSLKPDLGTARRLIILSPASAPDDPNLSTRIWEIASVFELNVMFFSLYDDFSEESRLRRRLKLMAAMINDDHVSTEVKILYGSNWTRQLKNILQPGDVIACWAGQKVGLFRRDLAKLLRSRVNVPIILLSGCSPMKKIPSNFIANVISWSGSIAIIVAFFWGEARIIQLPQDWAHTSLLYLGILLEIGLLWGWNSIFG